jgi:hypothetical protein
MVSVIRWTVRIAVVGSGRGVGAVDVGVGVRRIGGGAVQDRRAERHRVGRWQGSSPAGLSAGRGLTGVLALRYNLL